MKIGNLYEVVDIGARYTHYTAWAKKTNLKNFVRGQNLNLNKGDIVLLLLTSPHSVSDITFTHDRILAGVRRLSDNYDFIIGIEGLKEFPSEDFLSDQDIKI
jgi:hypothetical protein